MAQRVQPYTLNATGVTDSIDATYAPPGAMRSLSNLIPSPHTPGQLVPRPAAAQISAFAGFNTPTTVSALLVVGDFAWGFIGSSRFAGKDEPFCYDIVNGVFITLANVTAANCPTTQPTTGDWTPPTVAMITNGRFALTHPGYDGLTTFLGWIDISGSTLTGITGSTHTSTVIDTLSSNPINAGWQVGMKIAGANIPAGTYIVSMTAASVTLSQATTGSTAGVALTVTGGTAAAPIYGAGNLNTNPLTTVAKAVAQYGSRAWWAVLNFVVYSDTLNPQQVSTAAQALQIGDNQPITALAGLPLTSQINGGTLQSLICFKGAAAFTQITGDAALSTLAANQVQGSVGTLAPNTICATPHGLAFVAPDGVRIVGLDGVVKPPLGTGGVGIARPFVNALSPSRMCAAYNDQVLRVTSQNLLLAGSPFQEWWYHFNRDSWSGPHTFPNALIRPYFGTAVGPFIHFAVGVLAKLWASYAEPVSTSSYTENGTVLNFIWQSPLSPDNGSGMMDMLSPQSTLALQAPAGLAITILISDENGNTLDTVYLNGPSTVGATWGAFTWGSSSWGLPVKMFQQVPVNWNLPIVFKQLSVQITGQCLANFILGDLHALVQSLGYVLP